MGAGTAARDGAPGGTPQTGCGMAKRTDLTTHAYRKQRADLLAEPDVCHLCGHAGADVMAAHPNPLDHMV
ncbi:hypothetical protein [Streptomyces goshikiensis]|uniref:hypothetical protein n=1 Tax=Streptomyces goshikiensis TaxID=1942 RepID=UPI003682DB2E